MLVYCLISARGTTGIQYRPKQNRRPAVYQFSEKSRQYQAQLKAFMDEHIYPNEHKYEEQLAASPSRFAALPLMDELKT